MNTGFFLVAQFLNNKFYIQINDLPFKMPVVLGQLPCHTRPFQFVD